MAQTVAGDTESHVNRLVFDRPAVGIAELHPQGVEDNDGIHPVQCPALPFANLVQNGIGDAADQVGRDLQAIEIEQMRLDIPDRQTGGIKPDDLVIHSTGPGLTLQHQLGSKLLSRSRGTATGNSPSSPFSTFGVEPLRRLGWPDGAS